MSIPKPTPPKSSQKVEKVKRPQKRKPHPQPLKSEPKLSEHLMHRPFSEKLKGFKIEKESN